MQWRMKQIISRSVGERDEGKEGSGRMRARMSAKSYLGERRRKNGKSGNELDRKI